MQLINQTEDAVFASEALNSLVYFVDMHQPKAKLDAATLNPKAKGGDIERRVPYLKGEELFPQKKKAVGKKQTKKAA